MRMCSTLSRSTANCTADRQFRSVCTTTLAMFRCTNTSPGARPMIWFAGTRESEQPIHRNFGACCVDSCLKKSGSSARMRSAQALLRSSSSRSSVIGSPEVDADVLGFGEETHRFLAAFAAQARLFHAPEGRAQVALEPGVHPDDAGVYAGGEPVRAAQVGGEDRSGQAVAGGVGQGQRLFLVPEGLQR